MKTVVIIAVIAAVLIFLPMLIDNYIFNAIFKKPKRSTKVPDYYKETLHYKASQKGRAVMDKIHCDDIFIKSFDNLKLHSYLYYSPEGLGKKFVIGVHGYKSYARPEYGPYIEFYRSLGYSMLLPDDRAHAPSEGEYIGFGVLDRIDCVYWANYLVQRFGDDVEIILHGVSMGAATVLAASGEEDLPPQVKGIVADCGYTRAYDVLHFQLKQMHLPADLIMPRLEKVCRKKAGFDLHEHAPVDMVKKAKAPILIAHGEKDTMVPFSMAGEIYDAIPTEKMMISSPDAIHGETICRIPDEYHKAIRTLFNI